jgi:acyl-CoA dehydrogenase
VPFQNGPTRGQDIFVPIDYIIGGPKMAGQGWRMLVECLSVGRGITLPSNSTGGLKSVAMATGAYAHPPPVQNLHRQNGRDRRAAGAYRG